MMNHIRPYILLLLLAGVVAAGAAVAVEEQVITNQSVIPVELNKGKMVKLEQAVSSVIIADPNIADVQVISAKMLFVRGKKVGETSIYATDAQDNMVFSAVLEITHNLSKLEQTVKNIMPDADVGFRTIDGGLVAEGFAQSAADSEKINDVAAAFIGSGERMVNMIRTAGSDQVTLKVRVVEMSRNNLKKFGVNLQNITNNGSFSMQLLQGDDILFHTADPTVNAYSSYNNVLARSGTNSNFLMRYKDVSGLIDALESQGLANVLAEPTLTTISGSNANFLAGGQFPIPVPGENGTITIQYQPFGVSLNFTPVVLDKTRINVTVAPEVSTLDFNTPIGINNITYPILNTRRASSVIELGSGDTFMLAGLLKNEISNTISKFPGLGDMPVLGELFRSQQFQNNQTELVILVTPYIVRPVSDQARLKTPIDGYVPPTDIQRLRDGNLYQQEPMEKEPPPVPLPPPVSGDQHSSSPPPEAMSMLQGGFILDEQLSNSGQ